MKQIILMALTKKRTWVVIFAIVGAIVGQVSQEAGREVKATSNAVINEVFDTGDAERGAGER